MGLKEKMFKILPVTACFLAVGIGGATWNFVKSADANKANVITIAGSAEADSKVTISGTATMVLDQGDDNADRTQGITYSWNTFEATYVDGQTTDKEGLSYTVTREYSISLDTELAKYVEITSGATGNWTDGTGGFSSTVVLSYLEGKKPQNKTELDAMVNAINGAQFTVTVKATVADK